MDAATIEETNRLRVAMGMKPLPVPGGASTEKGPAEDEDPSATFEGRMAQAEDNYKKIRDAEAAKKRRDEKAAAIKKAREDAQRFAVLEGKGLGDLDDGADLDAQSWLKSQKKRQRKIEQARKLEEEQAAAEVAAAKQYSSKDLAGVSVGHDLSTFLDGDDQILTLKDSTVLDNEDEGDELENIDLREREKLNENLKLKKKKPVYDPNDIDETGERSILAQYDEEISGKKRKKFTLDAAGTSSDIADILGAPIEEKKLQSLDLDIAEDRPQSDYLDISEVKVKKPKKKKSKSTRQRAADDDDILFPGDDHAMDIDMTVGGSSKKRKIVDDLFVDDEDLQSTLAMQRRDALKKRKRVRPEDIARSLREEAQSAEPESVGNDGKGLVLDEISGFVGALSRPGEEEEEEERRARAKRSRQEHSITKMEDSDDDTGMDNVEDLQKTARSIEESEQPELTTTGVEEEKTISQGLGATLSILRDRGLVKETAGSDLNENFRRHELFVAERNRRLAQIDEDAKRQRERDRASGLWDRMSQREREEYSRKQNAQREYQASKVLQDMFNQDYRPNFNIKYVDDHGRQLDQKEAFKHMSHQFHGKGSGKGKTDKMLKKIEEEKKREAQSILDAGQNVNMGSAAAQQLKKRREAGVRLA
ncbi:uncharacterized protein E0L32_009282 [Thyridium curvatum]|uniref:SART-1 protein n=1 Tax=Thyridium curvatum TaxID=1093900 RepID=A0A507AX22_9PEZI|nr:uncharacterized protein E0L32_009282 [Thyridium curvatum]TPX09539.1 hypothetical protein E0L32_009282 [Thyridium curvatum]